MKKILVTFIISLYSISDCFPQAGEWTWISGDNSSNPLAVYGTQGIPSPSNKPPGLYEAAPWTDLNGNFWIFGGSYLPTSSSQMGDLWRYNPVANEWTWMKGTGMPDDPGSYGTIGVPSITNYPPARGYGAATWVDLSGDLWLFGGGSFNDLWRYNISTNTWTWMHGSSTSNGTGVYGTQGIPSTLNTPGARQECGANWIDSNGDLWLFAGQYTGPFDDLWRYHIATDEWTWMKGTNLINQTGSYGTMGIASPTNDPGSRWGYCSWSGTSGMFLLFGGFTGNPAFERFNDMWSYDPATNNWTWISGTNVTNSSGVYGNLCSPSVNYLPASRFENRARWKDACGKLWMYGGSSASGNLLDLWTFDETTLEWNLVDGNATPNLNPVFGTIGISDPSNTPGSRNGALSFTSNSGELYLFGGYVNDGTGFGVNCHNDLWRFVIDTACTGGCSTTGIANAAIPSEFMVYPDPSDASFTILFESTSPQIIEFSIYNLYGSPVCFDKLYAEKGNFSKEVNVESLSSGIYFLQIKSKNSIVNKKIVVQH